MEVFDQTLAILYKTKANQSEVGKMTSRQEATNPKAFGDFTNLLDSSMNGL